MNKNTAMFKCAAFNQIRKVLCPNGKKGEPTTLTVEEQFNEIVKIINSAFSNLKWNRLERKHKRKIEQQRKDRGYVPKKKTTKAEYELMKQNKAIVA